MAAAAQFPRRFVFCPMLVCYLGMLLFAGCGKPADDTKSQPAMSTNSAQMPASKVMASPNPNEKVCFECQGRGTVVCSAPGCVNGKVDCPGPCIKLDKGVWVKRPDHVELMQSIVVDGKPVWVSSHHLGVTYAFHADGSLEMITCPVCNGKAKVACPVCKGSGKQKCLVCNGKKFVPVAWTPMDNPWFNNQPDLIRLKDGRVVLGRVAVAIGDERTIITRDKQTLHLKVSDILPKPDTNPPAAKTPPSK